MDLAHLTERFLGGDPAIHDPGAIRLPVARFDGLQKISQSGFVRGVAWHDFVGQGKALGRHN